jgi:hypothetical protein
MRAVIRSDGPAYEFALLRSLLAKFCFLKFSFLNSVPDRSRSSDQSNRWLCWDALMRLDIYGQKKKCATANNVDQLDIDSAKPRIVRFWVRLQSPPWIFATSTPELLYLT